eukprot:Lithocolla_globosa_v1_NODE_199_length_5224_cov_8.409618.p4 type:complete len:200 gc:universal NODE_199_length_5224_cov_8.409618:1614-2213(+)
MRRRSLCTAFGGRGAFVLIIRSVVFSTAVSMCCIVGFARVGLIERQRCVGMAEMAIRRINSSACLLSNRFKRLRLFSTSLAMCVRASMHLESVPTGQPTNVMPSALIGMRNFALLASLLKVSLLFGDGEYEAIFPEVSSPTFFDSEIRVWAPAITSDGEPSKIGSSTYAITTRSFEVFCVSTRVLWKPMENSKVPSSSP